MVDYLCNKCSERNAGCHASCKAYLSVKEQNAREARAANARRMKDKELSDAKRNGYMRMTKGSKYDSRVIKSRKR